MPTARFRAVGRLCRREINGRIRSIKARFQVHFVHRRAGKSYGYLHGMTERLIECPFRKPRGMFTAQALDQAIDIAWEYLLEIAEAVASPTSGTTLFSSQRAWVPRPRSNSRERRS